MTASYQHYATHDESDFPHLWRGVVGAWAPCLGPSGTRLHDHSGRANWGTLTDRTPVDAWVVQSGQYALDFAGGGTDRVEGISPISLATFSQPFTWSAWIRVRAYRGSSAIPPYTNTYFPIASIGTANFQMASLGLINKQVNLLASSNGSSWTIGDPPSGNGIGTTQIDAGVWVHVAASRSAGGVYTAWLNGKNDGTRTLASNLQFNNNTLRIGSHYALNTIFDADGFVDDLTIWDRELQFGDMQELYQIGRGGMYTPRRRRRAYSYRPSLRRRLILTGQT